MKCKLFLVHVSFADSCRNFCYHSYDDADYFINDILPHFQQSNNLCKTKTLKVLVLMLMLYFEAEMLYTTPCNKWIKSLQRVRHIVYYENHCSIHQVISLLSHHFDTRHREKTHTTPTHSSRASRISSSHATHSPAPA